MRGKNILLFTTALLTGCSLAPNQEAKDEISVVEVSHHNYFEVDDKSVAWNKVFDVAVSDYYLYYYSPSCSHCSDLKDWIIETALNRGDIYFVKASENDIISKDVSSSINATTSDKIIILGYPSMIQIINKTVVKNVAGKTKIQELLSH